MNIHEYQGKELLRRYGVAVLEGGVAASPEQAVEAAKALPGPVYVVKAQIHAGGRGAGRFKGEPQGKGGVRIARSLEEVKAAATAMLGHTLVTKQTGEAGKVVNRVYVEAGCDIQRELYLSLLVDRASSRVRPDCATFRWACPGISSWRSASARPASGSAQRSSARADEPCRGFPASFSAGRTRRSRCAIRWGRSGACAYIPPNAAALRAWRARIR